MAKVPEDRDPTLDAVDQAIVRNTSFEPRSHLGCSEIGHECERRLWYKFHHVELEHIDAQGLRNIADGNNGEPIMAERLNAVPEIKLHVLDPKTGGQLGVSTHGGHFRGSMDGLIKGLLQAPSTWHIWDFNSRLFVFCVSDMISTHTHCVEISFIALAWVSSQGGRLLVNETKDTKVEHTIRFLSGSCSQAGCLYIFLC